MSDSSTENPLSPEAQVWLKELRQFTQQLRTQPLPTRDDLSPIANQQRRISGGQLIEFIKFVEAKAVDELSPGQPPISERAFLFLTDQAGAAAAQELIDLDNPVALVLLKEEWLAWNEDESKNDDDDLFFHYELWSAWHQNLPQEWEFERNPKLEYWVHEEGFALADLLGRGAQHLWTWDGEKLQLVEETMTSWFEQ